MRTYVLRRLLQLVPLLLAVVVLTFVLLKAAPGDFVTTLSADPQVPTATLEAMRHRFGLDRPWPAQLGLYVWNLVLRFDLGESFSLHRPVADVLRGGALDTRMADWRRGVETVRAVFVAIDDSWRRGAAVLGLPGGAET